MSARRRKVYDAKESTSDACPTCGCRHYECVSAWKQGEKVVVERICRNCGMRA